MSPACHNVDIMNFYFTMNTLRVIGCVHSNFKPTRTGHKNLAKAVSLLANVREAPRVYSGRIIDYPKGFRGSSRFLHSNTGIRVIYYVTTTISISLLTAIPSLNAMQSELLTILRNTLPNK
jgi:hypothetical protein